MGIFVRIFFGATVVLSLVACGSERNAAEGDSSPKTAGELSEQSATTQQRDLPTTVGEKLKFNYVTDPDNGIVQLRSPIPESWEVHGLEAPIYISGPHDLRVYKTDVQQFAWSADPFMRESIRQMGQALAPPASLKEILDQQVKPGAQSQGYRFEGSYEVPGVVGFWYRVFAGMPQTNARRTVEALATEWEAEGGTKSLILLVRTTIESPQSMIWQLQTTELEVSAEHYETAKSAYLYALASTEINPEWQAAAGRALQSSIRQTKRYWDNASQISRQAHQQRMQAIAARGAAAQSTGKIYSDILDISHKGYLTRDNLNSAGQSRTIQGIQNTTVIDNHETGESYNVDGNNSYYWVNNKGVYIGTDNALFDPRSNAATRNEQWNRFYKKP